MRDDLLRNRRIFEHLTVSPEGAAESGAPVEGIPSLANSYAVTGHESDAPIPVRYETSFVDAFNAAPGKTEAFSLEYGKSYGHETGIAVSFTAPESIDFPALSENTAPAPSLADPLESLYRRLEAEARRAPQLSREEDF